MSKEIKEVCIFFKVPLGKLKIAARCHEVSAHQDELIQRWQCRDAGLNKCQLSVLHQSSSALLTVIHPRTPLKTPLFPLLQ